MAVGSGVAVGCGVAVGVDSVGVDVSVKTAVGTSVDRAVGSVAG